MSNKRKSPEDSQHKRLIVKAIPVPIANSHPPPPNDVLPKHEFTMGLIAPKGSGKTTLIANLLNFYKGYFHTILVFSPTINSDDKWDWVKTQKLVSENKPLKNWIKNYQKKMKTDSVVTPAPIADAFEGLVNPKDDDFDGRIPENHFFDNYTEEDLEKVLAEQQAVIDLLHTFGKSKHLANRMLIVFDDLVGSSLFSGKKENPFKMLNTRHRHFSCSMLMVTQAYKEIPKTVRTQFSSLILFEISNEKELVSIYEEFPMGLKQPDWMQVYEHAVEGDHNFLYINHQREKRLRLMKNFDSVLFIDV